MNWYKLIVWSVLYAIALYVIGDLFFSEGAEEERFKLHIKTQPSAEAHKVSVFGNELYVYYNFPLPTLTVGNLMRYLGILALLLTPFTFPPFFKMFFVPIRVTRSLEDVEKDFDGKFYRGKRPRRFGGDVPPGYPNSWYKVFNSFEVKAGEARDIELLGNQLAVFRGKEDKKVRIVDAYCPHMGANLGVGGEVDGNDIVCPFHGWQFGGDGKCTKIPYTDCIPKTATTKAWHCTEANGSIYVWHDAEDRDPQWMVPLIKEIEDKSFRWHGASLHTVRAHIQEIPENGADTAHLNHLHVPFVLRPLQQFFNHKWIGRWEEGKGIDSHLAKITVIHSVETKYLGLQVPGTYVHVTIDQVGPSTVHLRYTTLFGDVVVIETVSPVQPLLQRVTHQVFAEKTVPRFAAKFVLWSTIKQFERDVPIWNNKTFVKTPMVCKGDGPLLKYRRWFKKNFFSENSKNVELERENSTLTLLDW